MKQVNQETKHTPGPWTVAPGQDTIWANDGDTKVAKVWDLPWIESEATGRRHSDDATERANATLIASAPELLEALEALVSNSATLPSTKDGVRRLQSAVAQARLAVSKATSR